MSKKNIVIFGTGYVGLSMSTLLAQYNHVTAIDIIEDKVNMINNHISPIKDEYIEKFLAEKQLDLEAKLDGDNDIKEADFVIIATPTNYDPEKNYFDTSTVESCIEYALSINPDTYIVVKSTIPIGFMDRMKMQYNSGHIMFSPEFLRESKALYDNLHPSRIIVGIDRKDEVVQEKANEFISLLRNAAEEYNDYDIPSMIIGYKEAEAIKLFANTYLAMRVSYFNELDTYAMLNHLNTADIINGISLDPRIGLLYNNPSFGYGGYCLPKDTKQLLANYKDIPLNMIDAIVSSNDTRKHVIAENIIQLAKKNNALAPIIGIYRLIMKSNSDNFRCSAIFDIMELIKDAGYRIIIYEPTISGNKYNGYEVVNDFQEFCFTSAIVVANRMSDDLEHIKHRVFTRDIFNNN